MDKYPKAEAADQNELKLEETEMESKAKGQNAVNGWEEHDWNQKPGRPSKTQVM